MLTDKQQYIIDLYNHKEYEKCISECDKLMRSINTYDFNNSEIVWFVYFRLALIYKQLNFYNKSIKWLQKAVKHTTYEHRKVQNYWMLGRLYEKTNKELSIDYYNLAIEISCKQEFKPLLIGLVCTRSAITHDLDSLNSLDDLLSECTEEECTMYQYTKKSLHNIINETYANIYIEEHQPFLAKRYINKIDNYEIRKILNQKMFQAIAC